jgi:hypothetical protein
MNAYKNYFRDLLGMALIVSVTLGGLSIMLDMLAILAYIGHEEVIADLFLHESFYLLAFLLPPYFIGHWVNRPEMVAAARDFQLMKSRAERA